MLDPISISVERPRTPSGAFAPKATVGEHIPVAAVIFRDGHDRLAARVRWRRKGTRTWQQAGLVAAGNDRWEGEVVCTDVGMHQIVVEAWTDRFATWRHAVEAKAGAGDPLDNELEEGAQLLDELVEHVGADERSRVRDAATGLRAANCARDVRLNAGLDDRVAQIVEDIAQSPDRTATASAELWVDRPLAGAGAWYELFPRSEGGFAGAIDRLAPIAAMGFDVVYLPPIHPIGTTARKGPNNTLVAGPADVGSPWAIGSPEGGHTAIHPDLGTAADLGDFVAAAADRGLEVALDYALQCSPDHPWVTEHPEWFHHRPDGSIKYAENPPKKYQDIYPINFWPDDAGDRQALWDACRGILEHWIGEGIRIFRVDNPHTKPLAFWAWVITELRAEHPDLIFLAEAFTRPAMMHKLAEIGFTQSYTYFTWRNTGGEIRSYVEELAHGPGADYMRPNFWPNTPDILSGPLRDGPPAAFALRLVLAATLVPNYGIYSGYELFENQPASETNEEYLRSEKYEVKTRDWSSERSLVPLVTRLNEIRRAHPSFRRLRDIRFHHSENEHILVYSRGHASRGDLVIVVVTVDAHEVQESTVHIDLAALGLGWDSYDVTDGLTGETYRWTGAANYVRFDPAAGQVAHVFTVTA